MKKFGDLATLNPDRTAPSVGCRTAIAAWVTTDRVS